tara:strand:+ start:1378 stop:2292 length:915 start_codon:yes stop_codon:yes gene_type:complete
MKNSGKSFHEYLQAIKANDIHENCKDVFLSDDINKLCNVIIYGQSGIGKYSKALHMISKYSKSNLRYEKKLLITQNKQNFCMKLSDIHFEIDVQILGCNSKLLWHEIYQTITDIVSTRHEKTAIVLFKNFHYIQKELLENLYSYMQDNNTLQSTRIVYFIVTDSFSFISHQIQNCCKTIHVSCPSKLKLIKVKDSVNNFNNDYIYRHKHICNKLIECLINYKELEFTFLREILYDLLIYNFSIYDSILYVLEKIGLELSIDDDVYTVIYLDLYKFLRYYNNNYRPIYHLELFFLSLVQNIHFLK